MRTIGRFHTLACLLVVSSLLVESVSASDDSAAIQARITAVENGLISPVRIKGRVPEKLLARMKERRVPGLSVAVINNYRIEWAKGYGLADSQSATPVTPETLFQAASISKPVTAVAALKLVEQGALDLDRDVNRQLKSWHVPENEFTRKHPVDLRGLLSHTAGMTVGGFPGGPLAQEVLGGIAAAYDWPGFLSPPREVAKLEPTIIDGYLGRYSLGLFGEVKLERRRDRLYAVPPLGGELELFFESAARFFTEQPGVTGRIVTNDKGQVSEIVVDFNGQQMHAKKKNPQPR